VPEIKLDWIGFEWTSTIKAGVTSGACSDLVKKFAVFDSKTGAAVFLHIVVEALHQRTVKTQTQ